MKELSCTLTSKAGPNYSLERQQVISNNVVFWQGRLRRASATSKLQMMFGQSLNTHRLFKRLGKALISLRVSAGWSELLLVAHTTLLEISCHNSALFCIPCNDQLSMLLPIWNYTKRNYEVLCELSNKLVNVEIKCSISWNHLPYFIFLLSFPFALDVFAVGPEETALNLSMQHINSMILITYIDMQTTQTSCRTTKRM